MPIPRPGITYNETVATITEPIEVEEVLCFIVQTSETLPGDGQLTLYESFDAFSAVATNKGLPKTLELINNILASTGATEFYVYSVKTDTASGFTTAVTSNTHYKEIRRVIYFEETASSEANPIRVKMNALASACHTTSHNGSFRKAIVIPYGTVEDAVNDEDAQGLPQDIALTTITGINPDSDGRLYVFMPDNYIAMINHLLETPEGVEPGFEYVDGVDTPKYVWTYDQMDTLRNAGINFLEPERANGVTSYRIHLGVTTGAKTDKADRLIASREIADALLRDIDTELSVYIKGPKNDEREAMAQETVDNVIQSYVSRLYVDAEGTTLVLTDNGDMTYALNGTITPTRTLVAIEVNTILQ